jgi:DNA-binding NtrC family response regulator
MKPLSILVVDDEPDIRLLVQQWLEAAGHAVGAVANGSQASVALQQGRFDLVITDVLMPDGDGVDLITEISRTHPAVRVVAISGGGRYTAGSDYLELAKAIGAHAAVLKPFTFGQLQLGIDTALAAQAAREW